MNTAHGVRHAATLLVAVVGAIVVVAVLTASTATAGGATAVDSSPAPLINDAALQGAVPSYLQGATIPGAQTDIFYATPSQQTALHALEAEAMQDTITDHHLATGDAVTAQTWGRPAALADLWGLLLKAVKSPNRDGNQAQAAAWLQNVFTGEAKIEAYDAGLEYVKWADFNKTFSADKTAYDGYVKANDWKSLKTLLSQPGQAYEGALGSASYGYCNYQSPDGDYTLERDAEGHLPLPCAPNDNGSCFPAACVPDAGLTPSFEQFVTWGIDGSYKKLVADRNLVALMTSVTSEFPFWLAAGSAAPPGGFAEGAPATDIAASLSGITGAISPGAEAAADWVGYGFDLAANVIGLVTEEIPGLDLVSVGIEVGVAIAQAVIAAQIPGNLVQLLQNAQGLDVRNLAATSNGEAALYIMFLSSTLPQPTQSCGSSGSVCLHAPPVVQPSSSDLPIFVSSVDGAVHERQQSSFSFYDAASKTSHCVYLHGDWFVDHALLSGTSECTQLVCPLHAVRCAVRPASGGVTVQTLHITYTTWDGKEQTAWVLPSGAGGHWFAIADRTGIFGLPGICLFGGECALTSQIYYRSDAQGDRFEAQLAYGNGAPEVPACTGTCGPSSSTTTVLSWTPPVPTNGDYVSARAAVTRNCPAGSGCPPLTGTVAFVQYRSPPNKDFTLCTQSVTAGGAICTWTSPLEGSVYATFLPANTNGTGGSQAGGYLAPTGLPSTTTSLALSSSSVSATKTLVATATVKNVCVACVRNGVSGVSGSVTFTAGGRTVCGPVAVQSAKSSATVTCPMTFPTPGRQTVLASFVSKVDNPSQDTASVTVT
jgi:hypothetical protein